MPVDFILFFIWGWYKDSIIAALTSTEPVRTGCVLHEICDCRSYLFIYLCVYILYIYFTYTSTMYICTYTYSCTSLASLPLYWWICKALWQIQTAAFFINHFSGSRRNVLSVLTWVLRGLCSSSCITHPSCQLCSSCVYHTVPSPAAPRSAGHQSGRGSSYSRPHVEIWKEKAVFS